MPFASFYLHIRVLPTHRGMPTLSSQAAHTPKVVLGARHPEERRYRASTAPKRLHTSALGQRPRSPLPGCCHKAPDDRHSSAPCITCRRHRCSARSERGKRMRVGLARADPRLLSRAAATSTTIATTSYAESLSMTKNRAIDVSGTH